MRGPLRHFFCYAQEQAKNCNAGQVMLQLVTGKLNEIHGEYISIMANLNKIIDAAMEMSGCSELFQDDEPGQFALRLMARKICFQQWASFQRRIHYPLQQPLG